MGQVTVPVGDLTPAPITVPVADLEPNFRATSVPAEVTFGRAAAQVGRSTYDALSELKTLNPFEFNRFVQSAFWHPLQTIGGVGQAQGDEYDKAIKAFKAGDYLTGAVRAITYLTPIVGPRLGQAIDRLKAGDYSKGVGATVDAILPFVLPDAVKAVLPEKVGIAARAEPLTGSLNPLERATNAFADEKGIPLDAATRTGSRTLRAAQKRVANSMGGEGTASDLITQQREGMRRVGGELADQAHPAATTPEVASQGVTDAMQGLIDTFHKQAGEEYGKFRELEAAPENRAHIPAKDNPSNVKVRQAREQQTTGAVVTDAERAELHRIWQEMESFPYVARSWSEASKLEGNAGGGHLNVKAGAGGAPVFDDIIGESDRISVPTRSEVTHSMSAALEGGHYNTLAKGALEVARKRLAGAYGDGVGKVSNPSLPLEARYVGGRGSTQEVGLPIDLAPVKAALDDAYKRLAEDNAVASLQGAKADALRTLSRLVNAPDYVAMSTAEGLLGDLKAMTRGTDASLRNVAQGTASYAIKHLDRAIREGAQKRSPEALQALELGRAATKGKYETAELLDRLKAEPVQVFRQLTAPKDAGIKLLRQVRETAPAQMPVIGRAWIEQALDLAQREGGFGHADRLWSDWNNLGRETKQVLFPSPGLTQALDQFFLLGKRIAENPNPSGTAHTLSVLNVTSQPAMYGLAKLLYTKRGVDALTRVLKLEGLEAKGPNPVVVSRAARIAAYANLAEAAKAAGVPYPLAADKDASTSGR